jgi:hypothetical protein
MRGQLKRVRRTLFSAIAIATASWALSSACGGHVATIGDGTDGGGSDGGVANDATPTTDATPVVDCNALKAELDMERAQAQTCCPFCNSLQCGVAIQDVCCAFSVTAPSAPMFTETLKKYEASCPQACPATPCPKAPSGICKPVDPQNPSSRGVCQ